MNSWTIGVDAPEAVVAFLETRRAVCGGRLAVCFDYFDTLVVRKVEPEHTKKIASAHLSVLCKGKLSGEELYRYRQLLELDLTTANGERTGELDFCLDDFAARFWSLLQDRVAEAAWHPSVRRREDFVRALIRLELAVEKAVQAVCPQTLAVVRALKERGFFLVLLSDFYLPQDAFLEMLAGTDLGDLFDRVYVSSAHGKGKGSGRLYQLLLEEMGCSPEQVVMFGDNLHADVAMARGQGIHTVHLQRPQQAAAYERFRRLRMTKPTVPAALFAQVGLPTVPFAEMGSSLWLFTHNLFHRLVENDAEDVFFLSKEGEFLKNLFDLYQQTLFGATLVRSRYLLASRKATFLPSLRVLEDEDFLRLFTHYRDISIRDFLQSLNFDHALIEELCAGIPMDSTERITDLRTHPRFVELLGSGLFRRAYEARRQRQRANFIAYLDAFGADYRQAGLHLVDVGWKGSIQDNIFHLLGGETLVNGYYVGSCNATEQSANNRKSGLLFANSPCPSPFFHVYNINRSLFEMLLGASHGSADSYELLGQAAADAEGIGRSVFCRVAAGGQELAVITLDLPEERELFEEVIKPLQTAMREYARQLTKTLLLADGCPPEEEWFARRHARMVFFPKKGEVDLFEQLYHLENFGIFAYTRFLAKETVTLRQRWRNLLTVLRNRQVLETGVWPPILLRRMGLDGLRPIDGWKRYVFHFVRKGSGRPGGKWAAAKAHRCKRQGLFSGKM